MSNLLHILQPHLEATLRSCAYQGSFHECNLLLNMHVNPLATGPGGKNALHLAAMGGHCRILSRILQLIEPTAINCKDENEQTPLHLAARKSHTQAIELLLNHGADHYLLDTFRRTPIELCPNETSRIVFESHLIHLPI